MLVSIRKSFAALEPEAQSWTCPEGIVKGATQIKAEIGLGRMSHEDALAAFEQELMRIAERQDIPLVIPAGLTAEALLTGQAIVVGTDRG